MTGRWSDNFADPNWWPTPPPKPPVAPSALKIALVVLLAAAAAGAVFAVTRYVHAGPKPPAAAPAPAPALRAPASGADRRQAFRDCLRSLGGGSAFRGGGRFGGGGPSKSFREANAICRSLLAGGEPAPAPGPAATTPAPVA